MNRKMISIVAPPAPKCYSARDIWIEYLISAQQAAVGPKIRPFVDDQFNLKFAACVDCPAAHAHAMHLAGRCDWRAYIASITPVKTETAEAGSAS